MKQNLNVDIDPAHHEDMALLRQALDDQGYTATDETIFIAWTLYSQDYCLSDWYGVPEIGSANLAARLMNYMRPVEDSAAANNQG